MAKPTHPKSSRATRTSLRSRTSVYNDSVTLYELGELNTERTLAKSTPSELGRSIASGSSKKTRSRTPTDEASGLEPPPPLAKRVKLEEDYEEIVEGNKITVSRSKPNSPHKSKSKPASSSFPPLNWRLVYDTIANMRYSATGCANNAPVDTMGCHMAGEEGEEGPEGEKVCVLHLIAISSSLSLE